MNVGLLLEMVADADGDRVLVGSRSDGLTALELLVRAQRAAASFRAAGGRNVGFVDLNSEAVPIALFGAAFAGLPFAPLNYRLADDALNGLVSRLSPGIVVAAPETAARLSGHAGIDVLGTSELMARVAGADADPDPTDPPYVDPDDVAVLLFTSGTTGEPKAAVLRHRHVVSYIIGTVEFLGADPADAQLVSVPSYHIAGLAATFSAVYSGRRIVYLPGFDAEEWVGTVQSEAITQAMVVPTMLRRVLEVVERDGADLSCVRLLACGGGRMPIELIERAMTLLPNVNFVNAYGLTETSSTISVLTPEDHRVAAASADPAVRRRLGSVGRPVPSIELEIRDPFGTAVPVGETGEIFVRGEQVAGEYLDRSVLTRDGWFPTNDAGFLDDDGFLYLEGRLDDVIVRGGENLSPGVIEATLRQHPGVVDAAVVGVPDDEWGEAVAAAVVPAEGADVSGPELQSWVRDRLRSTQAPELIAFRADLPYNETGKLLRRVIREELAGVRRTGRLDASRAVQPPGPADDRTHGVR
jgi:acyl-CoA synthetase (AMP-forming)/AMP-acid ligase II